MARFYSTFNGVAGGYPSAKTNGLRANYLAMTGGAALQSAILSARSTLSTQFYAQLDTGNRRGDTGIVLPSDGFSRSGGNLSWSNIYTNTGAVWPGDGRPSGDYYKSRPLAPVSQPNRSPITIASPSYGSTTAISPADSGSIADSYYTTAQTALENALSAISGGGPRGRYGNDAQATMATLWHDIDMTYLAWDDYTPGTPSSVAASSPNVSVDLTTLPNYPTSSVYSPSISGISWKGQYYADKECTVWATYTLVNSSNSSETYSGSAFLTNVSYGTDSTSAELDGTGTLSGATIPVSLTTPSNGVYDLHFNLTFSEPTYASLYGTTSWGAVSSDYVIYNVITFTRGY